MAVSGSILLPNMSILHAGNYYECRCGALVRHTTDTGMSENDKKDLIILENQRTALNERIKQKEQSGSTAGLDVMYAMRDKYTEDINAMMDRLGY